MTTETAFAANVFQGNTGNNASGYPSSGYVDKSGDAISSTNTNLEGWLNQSSGAISVSQFNGTSGDYAQSALNSHSSPDQDSAWILLYNFAANLSLTIGDTITDTSFAVSRVQGKGTGTTHDLFDEIIQTCVWNTTDFTSGIQGSNLANTTTAWPQISGTSPASGNFTVANYDFSTTPTYSNLTNTDWGLIVGVDGSGASVSGGSDAFINAVEVTVTYTASATVPGIPLGLSAAINSTHPTSSIDFTITPPSSNGGSAITSYQLQYYDNNGALQTVNTGSSSTSYTLTGCQYGDLYQVTVAATNSVGTGSYSGICYCTPGGYVFGIASAADETVQQSGGTVTEIGTPGQSGSYFAYRFENATITQGTTIPKACLCLSGTPSGTATLAGTAYCEAADNAGALSTSSGAISALTLTSHQQGFSISAAPEVWAFIDVHLPVQDVVQRPGFSSGDAIVVVLYVSSESSYFSSIGGQYPPLLLVEVTPAPIYRGAAAICAGLM